MSVQDGTQSSTKQRRSRKTNTANQQNGKQAPATQRPALGDTEEWKTYWEQQGQPWRTEPEIDLQQQHYLSERRNIIPNIEQGIYPFKDVKLARADIEWLLATYEEGRGPIFWSTNNDSRRVGLDLRGADLRQINLRRLPLAFIRGAHLREAQLQGARLRSAQLQGANLRVAQLQGAHLREAQLQGAVLSRSDLDGATLDSVTLSDKRYGSVRLADVRWGEVNLAVVDWGHVTRLGEEELAHQEKDNDGKIKDNLTRIAEYKEAVRANRQLAVALQSQGLNEDASRFTYRAQKLQRIVLRRRKKFGQYLFSGFLDLLAGYGYRPGRSVIWYLATIFVFALTYFAIGHLPFFPDAFVFSLTSFHGRGFFPGLGSASTLHNSLVVIAAFEAIIGLVIEISFIATFTQRFFGK